MSNHKFVEIKQCRSCNSIDLDVVLSLGNQFLTGVFPKNRDQQVTSGPLDLVFCKQCELVQLKQSYNPSEMYGENYGYRSGLNKSMVAHLTQKVRGLEKVIPLGPNDIVLDIGSNDSTTLNAYSVPCRKIGIDPTGGKFKSFYHPQTVLVEDFFSAILFQDRFKNEKAKLITSIAMFYDLENPNLFIKDIYEILDDEGIWHFEQSYMPSMLRTNSYDTICHEHLEFYSFKVVSDLLKTNGMRVIDVHMNSVNGGSFAVTAAKLSSKFIANKPVIDWMLQQEKNLNLNNSKPYLAFAEKIVQHRSDLLSLIKALNESGKKLLGYGASTKGNVLLQYCGIGPELISHIADVNPEKHGAFTPGTKIPIISEEEAKKMKPDYFVVLPWHFKHNILEREKEFLANGGKFIFPLPEIEII